MILWDYRMALINKGINIDPILQDAGVKVGEALYGLVADPEMEKFIENIARYWEAHKLGRVEVENLEPLTINVHDCFECRGLPYLGRSACAFDAGILKALSSAYYQYEQTVKETMLWAMITAVLS